jgi:RecB family endonuclease NucS
LSLPVIAQHYTRQTKSVARCPEYWMYRALEEQLTGVVSKTGQLRIRLAQGREPGLHVRNVRTPLEEQPIGPRIDEKSLETLLVNRPDLLEEGLTLFQRQCRIAVGIIDLLFVDKNRNYVVVEIKRPSADYREVVGQITTYMGWVRKNIARDGQTVRGIIVIGKKNQHLEYSLDLLPNISVRTFL